LRDGSTLPELLTLLDTAISDVDRVLASLSAHELTLDRTIQGRETNVLAAIYHVVEHFSMHTGQIIMMAKMYAPGSVRFYDDAGGNAVPLWGGDEGMTASGTP
jgi:Protein of unknown function (DUF1572).